MVKINRGRIKILLIILIITLASFGSYKLAQDKSENKKSKHAFKYKGTVKFINIEGGFFGIITDDSKHYDPTNLPASFKEDGLRVSFEFKNRSELASIHMWGSLIEITNISKI